MIYRYNFTYTFSWFFDKLSSIQNLHAASDWIKKHIKIDYFLGCDLAGNVLKCFVTQVETPPTVDANTHPDYWFFDEIHFLTKNNWFWWFLDKISLFFVVVTIVLLDVVVLFEPPIYAQLRHLPRSTSNPYIRIAGVSVEVVRVSTGVHSALGCSGRPPQSSPRSSPNSFGNGAFCSAGRGRKTPCQSMYGARTCARTAWRAGGNSRAAYLLLHV